MDENMKFKTTSNVLLYKYLSKFDKKQFKIFYALFVHYWAEHKYFISMENFYNLWCELNYYCHELDDSFPDPYDDFYGIKSFCKKYPYYFIDRLPIPLIAKLFAEHANKRVNILANAAKALYELGARATLAYINNALRLNESIDTLITEMEDHIKYFS